MRQLLNTLYVMTQNSYLHLENDTLRVDVEREKRLQVPLHHLGSVVCLGNIMLSPALMHRCADDGISLVLLNNNGRFKARLEGPVSGNIRLIFDAQDVAPAPRRGRGLKQARKECACDRSAGSPSTC